MKIVKALSFLFVAGLCLTGFSRKAYAGTLNSFDVAPSSHTQVTLMLVNNYSVNVTTYATLSGNAYGDYFGVTTLGAHQMASKVVIYQGNPTNQYWAEFGLVNSRIICNTQFNYYPSHITAILESNGTTCEIVAIPN